MYTQHFHRPLKLLKRFVIESNLTKILNYGAIVTMDIGASRIFFSFMCNQLIQHKITTQKRMSTCLTQCLLVLIRGIPTYRLLTPKSNDKLNSITSTQNLFENVVRLGPNKKTIEKVMQVVVYIEGI